MKRLLLTILLLAGCAQTVKHGANELDSGPCQDMEAKDCRAMLDQQNMARSEQLAALLAAGKVRLADEEPEYALPYFDAVSTMEPADPGWRLFMAKSLAALAYKFSHGGQIDAIFAKEYYRMAAEKYAEAIKLAPAQGADYGPGLREFFENGRADGCGLAKAVRARQGTRLELTAEQATLNDLIKKECGLP